MRALNLSVNKYKVSQCVIETGFLEPLNFISEEPAGNKNMNESLSYSTIIYYILTQINNIIKSIPWFMRTKFCPENTSFHANKVSMESFRPVEVPFGVWTK